jgi:hypothetical protein
MTFDAPSGATTATADLDETFATGPRCRLELHNVRGPIRVAGWDRPAVHVRATRLPGTTGEAGYHATRIETWHDGDKVAVRTVLEGLRGIGEWERWWHDLGRAMRSLEQLFRDRAPAKVEYDVRVPRQADLTLNAVSSDIVIDDVRGEVRVRTVNGDCSLTRVQGELDLHTVNGRLAGETLSGSARVQAIDGDVLLVGRLAGARVRTVSGAVELAGPLSASGRYDVTTVSGDATLRLPPNTGASISVRGVSVAVDGDLAATVTGDRRRPGRRRWEGDVNGGGASVRFQTVSGDLHLLSLPDEQTAPASETAPVFERPEPAGMAPETLQETPVEPPTDESTGPAAAADALPGADATAASTEQAPDASAQLAILRRLERGELTVEEALEQIEALRGDRV